MDTPCNPHRAADDQPSQSSAQVETAQSDVSTGSQRP
jgi:hypothetical protein